MKNTKRIAELLYFLAGILFIISSIIGKNYVFIPIGCCFICLGIVSSSKKKDESEDAQDEDGTNKDK